MQEEMENSCSLDSTSCDMSTVPLLNINLYVETILTEACLAETKANQWYNEHIRTAFILYRSIETPR